jgi:esterase/lipase superfamily enzyme
MAEWSSSHFAQFLKQVLEDNNLHQLHIIGHSMGNRILAETLCSQGLPAQEESHLGQIVFAAPDINRLIFEQEISSGKLKARRVTLYASDRDQALALSKLFHGYARARRYAPSN